MEEPGISKAEYELLAEFRYVLRQFLRFSEEAAERTGVSPAQHQALLAIKGYPGREIVTIGELAERLQIRHHSAVGLVDRLVEQGLAAREAAENRRFVYVGLTERGAAMLEALAAPHRAELRRIGPLLRTLLGRISQDDL